MNVVRQPVLLLFLAAGLVCLSPAPVRSEDSTNQVKSTGEQAGHQRQKQTFAKGTLMGIDFQRHELRLKTVGGVRTFAYTLQTYVFRDKDKVTVDTLKSGEIIALRFHTDDDGVSTVVRIKAYGPPTTDGPPPGPPISTNQLPNTSP